MKIIPILIPAILIFLNPGSTFGQTKEPYFRPAKNINFCVLGGASHFSLNFEKFFLNREKYFFSASLGMGKAAEYSTQWLLFNSSKDRPKKTYLTFPHHLTYNIGRRKSFFELGMGGTFIPDAGMIKNYIFYPVIGYRLQPRSQDKLNFRVFINAPPVQVFKDPHYDVAMFDPFMGISAGLSFD